MGLPGTLGFTCFMEPQGTGVCCRLGMWDEYKSVPVQEKQIMQPERGVLRPLSASHSTVSS